MDTADPNLRQFYERSAFVLLCIALFSAIAAPRIVAWIFPLLGAAGLIASPRAKLSSSFPANPATVICGLVALYLLLSTIWSHDRPATLAAFGLFTLYLASVLLAVAGTRAETDHLIRRIALAIPAALIVGTMLVLIELLSANWIHRFVFTHVALLRPSPKHVAIVEGVAAAFVPDELNRNIAIINLLLWPALLVISGRGKDLAWNLTKLMLFLLVGGTTFLSEHESSKLAFICSTFAFMVWRVWPRASRWVAAFFWTVATLLVVPAVLLAYRAELHAVDWLAVNARARVIIWAATADQVRQHPIVGVGAGATRRLQELRPKEQRYGHVLPWTTSSHAHNVYLQTWYELGCVGAMLLLGLGLSFLSSISKLSPISQGFALSSFASGATIAGLSWGMWQPWHMAAYFLTIGMLAIGVRQAGSE